MTCGLICACMGLGSRRRRSTAHGSMICSLVRIAWPGALLPAMKGVTRTTGAKPINLHPALLHNLDNYPSGKATVSTFKEETTYVCLMYPQRQHALLSGMWHQYLF